MAPTESHTIPTYTAAAKLIHKKNHNIQYRAQILNFQGAQESILRNRFRQPM
jgi:hypothetical protein